jgi:hypothetical protein
MQQFPLAIEQNGFATRTNSRVDRHHGFLAQRWRQQKLT